MSKGYITNKIIGGDSGSIDPSKVVTSIVSDDDSLLTSTHDPVTGVTTLHPIVPEPLEGSGTTRYFRSNGKPSYNGTMENYAFPNNASNISAVLGNSPNGVYLDIEGVTVNDDLTLANKPGIATLAGWYGRKAIRNSLSLTDTNAGLNFKDMGFLNDSSINDISNSAFYRCDFNANLNIGAGKIGKTRLIDCSIGDPSDATKTLTVNAPVNTVSGLDTSLVVIKGSGNGVLYLNMLGDATAANSKQLQVYVEGFTPLILLNLQAGHLYASNIPLLYFVSSTAPKHINNQIALIFISMALIMVRPVIVTCV